MFKLLLTQLVMTFPAALLLHIHEEALRENRMKTNSDKKEAGI
jgi:hypothetical protein